MRVGAAPSLLSARRSFLTSTPHSEPAAADTPKKTPADKKTAVKKVKTDDEAPVKPKRKVAAKKPAAKTVAKKPKVEKPKKPTCMSYPCSIWLCKLIVQCSRS